MDGKKYKLAGPSVLTLPLSDADKLISGADGEAALLYLYLLRRGGELSPEAAGRALGRSEAQIDSAAAALERLGLLSAGARPEPAEELPEYTAVEVSKASDDPAFRAVIDECQRVLGRMLSGSDIRILFGVYSYLGLPAEVIVLLLNHCAEQSARRFGPGRKPSLKSVEKEAYRWANREILTLDLAEEYLSGLKRRESEAELVKSALQIRGRELTRTERDYIESWLELGFGAEALEIAYDRTVTNTGSMKWKYMDSIVRRWHAAKLHTAEEIESADHRRADKPAQQNGAAASGDDLDRARRMLEKARKG